ncbi:hypothetical protein ACXYTP_14375 [Tsukamurella ocularis]|uniref:hypothetical protein n=1 Tax=Tsukamurella ocularis TaxID=1970234 RepID=UPI0039EF3CC6
MLAYVFELTPASIFNRDGDPSARTVLFGALPLDPTAAPALGTWTRGWWPESTATWERVPEDVRRFLTCLHDGLHDPWGDTQPQGILATGNLQMLGDRDQPYNMEDKGAPVGRRDAFDGAEIEEFDRADWPDMTRLLAVYLDRQYSGIYVDAADPTTVWEWDWEGMWRSTTPIWDAVEQRIIDTVFGITPPSPPPPDEPHLPAQRRLELTAAITGVFANAAAHLGVPLPHGERFNAERLAGWADDLPTDFDAHVSPPAVVTPEQVSAVLEVLRASDMNGGIVTRVGDAIADLAAFEGAEVRSVMLAYGPAHVLVSALTLAHDLPARDYSTSDGFLRMHSAPWANHPEISATIMPSDEPHQEGTIGDRIVTWSGVGRTGWSTRAYCFASWFGQRNAVTLFATVDPARHARDDEEHRLATLHTSAVRAVLQSR